MASINKRKDWYYVRFMDLDGVRRTIALRTKSERRAINSKLKIEDLISASKTGQAIGPETKVWLAQQKAWMRANLVKFSLIDADLAATTPGPLSLAQHIDSYIAKRTDVKPSTKINWGHTRRNLVDFFGADKPLAQITTGDAKDFERHLKSDARETAYAGTEATAGLSPDTVRKRISNSKQFFHDAVEHEIIDRNPFAKLRSSVVGNRDRDFFVTREMAEKVLDACPDAQWRLLFALSRFGGLRCPSEHIALRLDAVDWDAKRIRIDSPKTEHHDGKAFRIIPLFPELQPHLEEVWHQAGPGEEYFITRYRDPTQNLRTQLSKIIKRAGLKRWPKLWQNLRASRQTELEEYFPSHGVCQWIGNSLQVARKHYLQVTDSHDEKAASKVANFVASKAPQGVVNEKCDAAKPAENRSVSQNVAVLVGDTGLEPVTSAL